MGTRAILHGNWRLTCVTAAYGRRPSGSMMTPSGWSRLWSTTTGRRPTFPDGTTCAAHTARGGRKTGPEADEALQIIFKAKDPYNDKSWSNAVHFNYTGYDTEPFWEDGKSYITGAHAWQVG